jgi:hypothetical protein
MDADSWDFDEYAGDTDTETFEDSMSKYREYGNVYKHVQSESIKEQMIKTAPAEVINAYAAVVKNILVKNITLTPDEFEVLKPYKDTLKELGFKKMSLKRQRDLLAEGDIFETLSNVMSKIATARSAYQFRRK